jgi:hypothetical protein
LIKTKEKFRDLFFLKNLSKKQKNMRLLFLLFLSTPLFAQVSTNNEIFLFDVISENNELRLENGNNISQNPGYDNQPSFYSEEVLIYARTFEGQTEIAAYNLETQKEERITRTGVGSEYSPSRIPETENVAAVRLDTTGLQRLYRYEWETGESRLIHPELKIGYFAFFTEDKVLITVLAGAGMELIFLDLKEQRKKKIVSGAGRSLHKIPGTESMSYTAVNNQNEIDLYLLDNIDGEPESFFLTALPQGVQDYVWLDKNRILAGKDNRLFLYDMLGESEWLQVADLSDYGLKNITRLSVNSAGNKLALSAEIREK